MAEVIEALRSSMQRKELEYEALFSSLLDLQRLSEVFHPRHLHRIIDTLRQRGYKISWWLLTSGPPKTVLPQAQEQAPTLTLGERVALARKSSPQQIEKLLYDQNEAVIGTLLNNPRLTENEVLKIASSPRTGARVLQTMARNPRWMPNYKVKLALIYNANTPGGLVLGLLNYLVLKDLEEVCQSSHLNRELREAADNLLRERILSLSSEERSALALGASIDLIKLLLENPTPLVLLGLLENPHLTTEEILLIAQDPRTPAEILERIGHNLQWAGERAVALALIQHPQCPPDLQRKLYRYLKGLID